MTVKKTSWERFEESVSGSTRDSISHSDPDSVKIRLQPEDVTAVKDEYGLDFDRFVLSLSDVGLKINGIAGPIVSPVQEEEKFFHLVEMRNGELPQIRRFNSAEHLAGRLKSVIGEDIFVVPFYGCLFSITQHPDRALVLSDTSVIDLLASDPLVAKSLPEDAVASMPLQSDYYVGPPELVSTDFDAYPYLETSDDLASDDDLEEEDDDDEF